MKKTKKEKSVTVFGFIAIFVVFVWVVWSYQQAGAVSSDNQLYSLPVSGGVSVSLGDSYSLLEDNFIPFQSGVLNSMASCVVSLDNASFGPIYQIRDFSGTYVLSTSDVFTGVAGNYVSSTFSGGNRIFLEDSAPYQLWGKRSSSTSVTVCNNGNQALGQYNFPFALYSTSTLAGYIDFVVPNVVTASTTQDFNDWVFSYFNPEPLTYSSGTLFSTTITVSYSNGSSTFQDFYFDLPTGQQEFIYLTKQEGLNATGTTWTALAGLFLVRETATSSFSSLVSSSSINFTITELGEGLGFPFNTNEIDCDIYSPGTGFWNGISVKEIFCRASQTANNVVKFVWDLPPQSASVLLKTVNKMKEVFPVSVYFDITEGVRDVITGANVTSSETLDLNIQGLNGQTFLLLSINSSTIRDELVVPSQVTAFGTLPACDVTCAQNRVNNLSFPVSMGVWMIAGIRIVKMISDW